MPDLLVINPAAPDMKLLARAVAALLAGKVIVYPTDTLYGLGADPRNAGAVAAVFRIKGRSAEQSLPVIAASIEQVSVVVQLNEKAEQLASRFWPGPLTLVLRQTRPLAEGVGQNGSLAVRVPDHSVARALAAGFGFPITSTSANRSGEPPSADARGALAGLEGEVALVLDAGAARGGPPSTIVDLTTGEPRLVRTGAIAWDRVLKSLK